MENTGDIEVGNVRPETYTLNLNSYATTKTAVAGIINISLLASNANQIRLIMELNNKAKKLGNSRIATVPPQVGYNAMQIAFISLLVIAIVLQFISAMFIIAMGTSKADLETSNPEHHKSKRILNRNNNILLGITTVITFINVLAVAMTGS